VSYGASVLLNFKRRLPISVETTGMISQSTYAISLDGNALLVLSFERVPEEPDREVHGRSEHAIPKLTNINIVPIPTERMHIL